VGIIEIIAHWISWELSPANPLCLRGRQLCCIAVGAHQISHHHELFYHALSVRSRAKHQLLLTRQHGVTCMNRVLKNQGFLCVRIQAHVRSAEWGRSWVPYTHSIPWGLLLNSFRALGEQCGC
jgi:hypothetical protein